MNKEITDLKSKMDSLVKERGDILELNEFSVTDKLDFKIEEAEFDIRIAELREARDNASSKYEADEIQLEIEYLYQDR